MNLKLRRQHATGLVGLTVIVLVIWLCLALYAQAFRTYVQVTVISDRAGLLMDPGAAVKLNGVIVGRVGSVEPRGRAAELTLELDPERVEIVPADTAVSIVPTTVFGAKYVALSDLDGAAATPISEGAVIEGARVNVEVNQTFDAAHQALGRLAPAKLNAALSAISELLDGKGDRLGQLIRAADALTSRLTDDADPLATDITLAGRAASDYEPAVDDLAITSQAGAAILMNLALHEAELQAALTTAVNVSDHVASVLRGNEAVVDELTEVLLPAAALAKSYAPSYECTLLGVAENDRLLSAIMGGPEFGGTHRNAHVTFMAQRGLPPYTYPNNLPRVAANSGPNCAGLPYVDGLPPYYNFDTGANPYVNGTDGVELGDVPIGLILFGQEFPLPGSAE